MHRARAGCVFLLTFLVSGCVGGTDPASEPVATTSEPPPPAAPAEVSADTGALQGAVVDDEKRPIVGANVAVLKTDLETVTDEGGAFTLNGVLPGSAHVAVQALGYASAARNVDVAAGEVAWANFTLTPIAIDETYVQAIPRVSFVDFGQHQLDLLALSSLNRTCQNCKHPFTIIDDPGGFMVEYVFAPTVPWPAGRHVVCATLYRNYVGDSPFANNAVNSGSFITVNCLPDHGNVTLNKDKSPTCTICVRTPKDQITLYVTGAGYNAGDLPNVQQKVEIWVSIAHKGPIPEGYTAAPPK